MVLEETGAAGSGWVNEVGGGGPESLDDLLSGCRVDNTALVEGGGSSEGREEDDRLHGCV